jgi:hypothetical protein
MHLQSKSIHDLHKKLTRKQDLISKWSLAAQQCDDSNPVGRATKRYCLGLAQDAQEKKQQIEAELQRRAKASVSQSIPPTDGLGGG